MVKFYAAQLVLTLEYLKSQKVAHRDLKPANIMVCKNKYIKIIDFGEAKFCDNYEEIKSDNNSQSYNDKRRGSVISDGQSSFFARLNNKNKNTKFGRKGTFVGTPYY